MKLIACLAAFVAFSMPAHAQSLSAGGEISFNPLTVEGLVLSDGYTIDAEFGERFGRDVPAHVQVFVPRMDGLHVRAIAVPDGGSLMSFVFSQDAANPDDRVFLENLQITNATIPMMLDEPDPMLARLGASARLLEQQVFPQWNSRYQNAEILAVQEEDFGGFRGAEMIARYFDQENNANMLLRAAIVPHPDQPGSYMAVSNIDLDRVPVTDGESLANSVSGRVMDS